MTTATPAELACLVASGQRSRAASLLVRDHAAAVFALCRAIVRDPRLAEDLSQDTFMYAFGALARFRGAASPRTWLLRIARNRCFDHLDRARRAPWAAGDSQPDNHAADAPAPDALLSIREDTELAMSTLGETERAFVVLHFGHGVSHRELAELFGLREGAVRMRVSRALSRMRAALADDDDAFAAEITQPFLAIPVELFHPAATGALPDPPGVLPDGSVTQPLPEAAADQPPALAFLSLPDDLPAALQSRLDAMVGDDPAAAE
jgi:RNA polymerase sigma-70 factor (ECF subfamily)